jgi:hypothetical protein
MPIQDFDEKGKIFTNIVPKTPVPAIIQTLTHRIHGEVYMKTDERLKDELNRSEQFIAVTNAQILDSRGEIAYACKFLTINKDQIVWLIPDNDLIKDKLKS